MATSAKESSTCVQTARPIRIPRRVGWYRKRKALLSLAGRPQLGLDISKDSVPADASSHLSGAEHGTCKFPCRVTAFFGRSSTRLHRVIGSLGASFASVACHQTFHFGLLRMLGIVEHPTQLLLVHAYTHVLRPSAYTFSACFAELFLPKQLCLHFSLVCCRQLCWPHMLADRQSLAWASNLCTASRILFHRPIAQSPRKIS